MDNQDIILRSYRIMKDYHMIYELSLNSKISNLAYDEIMLLFLEIIHKFDGMKLLKELLSVEVDDKFKIRTAMFFLPYDQSFTIDSLKNLKKSEIEMVRESAKGTLKSSLEKHKVAYISTFEKLMKRKKIVPIRNFS